MPLVDLIYRCPRCGSESVRGEGRISECDACGRRFEHVGGGGTVVERDAAGEEREVSIAELISTLPDGPPEPDEGSGVSRAGTTIVHEASVRARYSRSEKPVRYRRSLLGFVEQLGATRRGTLRLDSQGFSFTDASGAVDRWPLRDIRAVQTSSAAVQVSPLGGGVVSFRFENDSPRRWEELLKRELRATWREEGRGEIVEFQPRIRSRPIP